MTPEARKLQRKRTASQPAKAIQNVQVPVHVPLGEMRLPPSNVNMNIRVPPPGPMKDKERLAEGRERERAVSGGKRLSKRRTAA